MEKSYDYFVHLKNNGSPVDIPLRKEGHKWTRDSGVDVCPDLFTCSKKDGVEYEDRSGQSMVDEECQMFSLLECRISEDGNLSDESLEEGIGEEL